MRDSDSDWTTLFDGESLDAWFTTGDPDGWRVDDGCIYCPGTDDLSDGSDYLFTEREYGDYVLKLEFKTAPDANSGVFLRTSDPEEPIETGIEVQILDTHGVADPSKYDAGALYDLAAPTADAVRPAGEWNHLQVICRGPRIREVLNGETIINVDLDDWDTPGENPDRTENKFDEARAEMPRRGHIGLQDHGNESWFRNVRISEF